MEYYEFDLLNDSLFEGDCSDEEMGDYCITLSAKTDNFSGLSVGKNHDTGTYLQISDDKIYIFKDQNEIYQTELNLKIRDNGAKALFNEAISTCPELLSRK